MNNDTEVVAKIPVFNEGKDRTKANGKLTSGVDSIYWASRYEVSQYPADIFKQDMLTELSPTDAVKDKTCMVAGRRYLL